MEGGTEIKIKRLAGKEGECHLSAGGSREQLRGGRERDRLGY